MGRKAFDHVVNLSNSSPIKTYGINITTIKEWKKHKYFTFTSMYKHYTCSYTKLKWPSYEINCTIQVIEIIISRDVKFNENETWDWSIEEENYDTRLYKEEQQTKEGCLALSAITISINL